MTREEIKKAIENGESVWCVLLGRVEELKDLEFAGDLLRSYNKIDLFYHYITSSEFFYGLYKTKAEAEHYLNHANVTRTETLPFLTWEEFDKGDKLIRFIGKNGERCKLEGYKTDNSGFIDVVVNGTGSNIDYDYTEANFYKAYDECVRLFKGEVGE